MVGVSHAGKIQGADNQWVGEWMETGGVVSDFIDGWITSL